MFSISTTLERCGLPPAVGSQCRACASRSLSKSRGASTQALDVAKKPTTIAHRLNLSENAATGTPHAAPD